MNEASRFLNDHTAEVEPLSHDYNLKYWQAALTGGVQEAADSAAAKERLAGVYSRPDEFETVQRLLSQTGHDALTVRQLQILSLEYGARQMKPEVLAEIIQREEDIERTFNAFRATLEGRHVSDNDLRQRLREETHVDLRRQVWEASKQIGAEVHDRLLDLVRLRNREARRLGHRDYYAMALALQELDETELFSSLRDLENATADPFRRMKAEIDQSLAARYGVTRFEPYPWMYADPFFQEAPPGSAELNLDQFFTGKSLEDLTRKTFDGLNLPVDDLFSKSDFYERDGKCQHAFCTNIDRKGDVRVLCNIKPDEYWMTTMLHEFGHAAYDKFLDPEIPFLLRAPAHTATTEAIAMLMGRLTRNSGWLAQVAGVSGGEVGKLRAEIARALRIQMLIFMRWGLLVVGFERELYRDPDQDLSSLWWQMAGRLQMIAPPPGRTSPDWASKIHFSGAPVYYQNYILGELMASQIESAIQAKLPAGAAFIDRPDAGGFLTDRIFRPGASRNWQDTLRHATGEPLNPGHFMQQFVDAR